MSQSRSNQKHDLIPHTYRRGIPVTMPKFLLNACLLMAAWMSVQLTAADFQLPAATYTQNGQVIGPYDTVESSTGTTTVASGAVLTIRATQSIALGANPQTASFGTVTVASGGKLGLEAEQVIYLEPGFTARAGSNFTARLVPVVTTAAISGITTTTANGGGTVVSAGSTPVTARGVCWAITENPTTANSNTVNGSGLGSFSSALTGLTSGTTYYVRAYATNGADISYGQQVWFTTLKAPVITTQPADTAVNVNQPATFTVVASGVPAPTYQWRRNGTILTGATSASYTTPGTVIADHGALYSVMVSNSQGTATSRNAVLSVTASTRFQEVWANANPATVVGTNTTLFGTGATIDNPAVTYTWSVVGYVPGPVTFTENASHAAKQTVATFTKPGRYIFCLRASDSTVASTNGREYVVVNVSQSPTSIVVTPATALITVGGKKTFTGSVRDQFGGAILGGKALQWSTPSGAISTGGVFTGPNAATHIVTCTDGVRTATATVKVKAVSDITQLWLERVLDRVEEPASVPASMAAGEKVMFRLFVQNPKLVRAMSSGIGYHYTKSEFQATGTATRTQVSGVFVQNTANDYALYSYGIPSGYPIAYPDPNDITPTTQNYIFTEEQIDSGTRLFAKDIWILAAAGRVPGHPDSIEGTESVTLSILPGGENFTIPEIVPEGKSSSLTGFIVETSKGYVNAPPLVTVAATATPSAAVPSDVNLGYYPLSNSTTMTTSLSVQASDNMGETRLTYAWDAVGTPPAPVVFSGTPGTNGQKNTVASFSEAGTYTLRVTITDREGTVATSQVVVPAKHAPTPVLKIIPENIAVMPGQQQQFTAIPVDQFGNPMDDLIAQDGWKPTGWVVSGGGTISSTGLFTAGATSGGPHRIIAYSAKYTNPALYVPAAPPTDPQTWSCSGQAKVTVAPAPVVTLTITEPVENAVMTTVPFMAKVPAPGDNVLDVVRLDGYLLQVRPSTPYQGLMLISPPDGPYTILAEAETIYGTRVTTTRNVMDGLGFGQDG